MDLEKICRRYIDREVLSVTPLGGGNINDTYLADTLDGKYVLQRLQRNMDTGKLEYNYRLYSRVCEEKKWCYPMWLRDTAQEYFYTDENGDNWRIYRYIDGDILASPISEESLYACGQGLADMHSVLSELSGRPAAVYPNLHDPSFYYEEYKRVLYSNELCEEYRDSTIEDNIRENIGKYISYTPINVTAVHGDTKLSNIIFSNGKVIGFLDYDTVMEGTLAGDIADCIRSCCVSENRLDKGAAGILLDGYIARAHTDQSIIAEVFDEFHKICFELALRYYTDAVSLTKKFREKYPGYCLERAKALTDLLRAI